MFIVDSNGVARLFLYKINNFARRRGPRRRAVASRDWFQEGRKCLEGMRYDEALFCFEEAKRLGHRKARKAITLCRNEQEEKWLEG